jgi:hypothetical protein
MDCGFSKRKWFQSVSHIRGAKLLRNYMKTLHALPGVICGMQIFPVWKMFLISHASAIDSDSPAHDETLVDEFCISW